MEIKKSDSLGRCRFLSFIRSKEGMAAKL